ncbi:ERCC4 domain-containing protein [Hypoxylon sp. NC1633]|nr:ERCC4 domain-containing protein [Hypoxylon sp. NC1633]
MPPEVVSLLSSSPAAPSPPILATSPEITSRSTRAAPSRVLDYGIPNSTADFSKKAAKGTSDRTSRKPISGAKRASNGHSRQDNDFLFLSDDFDTTGDLDGNVAKKVRVSTSATDGKRKADTDFKRTNSAVVTSTNHRSASTATLRRWNSVADPIEHSSSPNGFATREAPGKPINILSDPFNSSPKKRTSNAMPTIPDLSSDIFRSSPKRDTNYQQSSTNTQARQLPSNDPFESSKKKSSKTPVVIDLSDDDFDDQPGKQISKASKPKAAAWDPISSSMPEPRRDNDDLGVSDSDDLPELADIDFSKVRTSRFSWSLSPSPPRTKPRAKSSAAAKRSAAPRKSTEPKKTEEEKEQEKKKKAEAREAEKERKRLEKEQAKEQRAIEKQKEKALAEVNKLKTDRKVAVPEMIVDLPSTLNVGIKTQIEKLLGNMDVQFEYSSNPVDNVVKWRRKVTSKFNEELGYWEPIPMHVRPEEHVMAILEASEFVKLVLAAEGADLEAHVLRMKTSFPGKTLVYLIEGLMPWMRKNKNALNRRFASAVRALDANGDPSQTSSSSNQSRRRNNNNAQQEYIDEDVIEDALLSLQVLHGALIHHTNASIETAQWVTVFTQHISTVPYRRAREAAADAGFCMEAGQVRTGDDAADTYARMLQEVNRVTAPVAYGVAARYASVASLVRGLESHGPLALENCQKCANRDGAFTDRVVGPAASKRLFKIFTGRDPGSLDV